MSRLRRHLTAIGLGCLLFQAVGFAMSPLVTCCAIASKAAVEEDECCKGMAPGQMCPLHKHRQGAKTDAHHDQPAGGHALRSGCAPVDPALISLAFGLGILPEPVSLDVIPVSIPVDAAPVGATHRTEPPEPAPPRA